MTAGTLLKFNKLSSNKNARLAGQQAVTASNRSDVTSALAVPAPDGGVVTDGDEDAAVTAEAGLADSGGAAGQRQRGAPGGGAATLVRRKAGALHLL